MLENASIIGNTPMIKINYEYKGKKSYVYTKLEFYNLTGSIKDRVAFYIINNANYDTSLEKLKYSKADDVLLYRRGICSSYTDAMSIFLNRFNINNYKIASEEHIWNLVYLNNNWLHLDLTWDDPINNLNQDLLVYDYYLLNNDELLKADKDLEENDHLFDKKIYNFVS